MGKLGEHGGNMVGTWWEHGGNMMGITGGLTWI